MPVTRDQAEQALACVRQQFNGYIGARYPAPELVQKWEPFIYRGGNVVPTEPVPFAIMWPEGPSDWAHRANTGGRDVELTLELRSVPGVDKNVTVDTPQAVGWPDGVREEPYFSYVLGLYED